MMTSQGRPVWLMMMRIKWRGRNVSSLGVGSKHCMIASRIGMGSFGPNKSSMSTRSWCSAGQNSSWQAVTCDM